METSENGELQQPDQQEQTDKLYYSISEVSEMFGLNASTLRFWEKEFEQLKPNKSKKGNRLFTRKDIESIARIVDLVKNQGFTIQGAREQLKKRRSNSNPVNDQVIESLEKIREKLIDIRDNTE